MAMFVYLFMWSTLIESRLIFSVEMLFREEESLFGFSADATQKKTG